MGDAFRRFCDARAEMSPPVKANTADTGKYRYSYAGLPDVKAVVDPPLRAHGLELVQFQEAGTLFTEVRDVDSGEVVARDSRAVSGGNDQARGSSETYQRRYAQLCVCGLAPVDDDGRGACAPENQPPSARQAFADAVAEYAARWGREPREVWVEWTSRPGFDNSPAWFASAAAEIAGM